VGCPGYGRVFVGISSEKWGNASFANLFEHKKSECEGYAIKLKPEEIKKVEEVIGVPKKMYKSQKIKLKKLPFSEGDKMLDGETYLAIDKNWMKAYKTPSP